MLEGFSELCFLSAGFHVWMLSVYRWSSPPGSGRLATTSVAFLLKKSFPFCLKGVLLHK